MSSTIMSGVTRLRLKLLEEGGPQYIIAARAGMAPSRLSEYALGQRKIPTHHMVSLCRVLKCNPQDITGWAEETVEPYISKGREQGE